MSTAKRGRPRKIVPFFKDGSPAPITTRPESELARRLAEGAAARDAELKKRWGHGPYRGMDLIYDLEWGDQYRVPVDREAERKYAESLQLRSQLGVGGGKNQRPARTPEWAKVLNGQIETIKSKLSTGRGMSSVWKWIRKDWSALGGSGAPPSERTMYDWAARNTLQGPIGKRNRPN